MTSQHHDFRSASLHLSGLVPALLGWTPNRFWNATPAELSAILKALSDPRAAGRDGSPLSRHQLQQLTESLDDG